jgi:hypothetical protein
MLANRPRIVLRPERTIREMAGSPTSSADRTTLGTTDLRVRQTAGLISSRPNLGTGVYGGRRSQP